MRLLLLLGLALLLGASSAPRMPALVLVSRHPVPGEPSAIPGLGPHHRAVVTGGRLLERSPDGRVRDLLPPGALFDVSDPAVSPDGRRIAFAGTPHPDSGWRIYACGIDGDGLAPVTRGDRVIDAATRGVDAKRFRRYDDLDPCWISDRELCFASTRQPGIAQYADVPVTNLYVVRLDGSSPVRITAERNGAEEPAFDPATGRLIYARWWFNRFRASRARPGGITVDPREAMPGDSVNLWQALELEPDGAFRLAAGEIESRRGTMAYQPACLPGGAIVGVYAMNLGLSPTPAGTGIQRFTPGRAAQRLAGAIVSAAEGDAYHGTRGLAPPSACSPAGLDDGRIVFAYDAGARGDFGIYVIDANGKGLTRVVDLPGTLELDPAPIVARSLRTAPPAAPTGRAQTSPSRHGRPEFAALALDAPRAAGGAADTRDGFVFFCRNLYATGPLDSPVPDAPAPAPGARLRFFAALPRFDRQGGDTAVLVREVRVDAAGAVRAAGLPAGVPMFEQLVDRDGAPLASAHGPAHVAGLNFGRSGRTVRCVGCHLGHSTLPAGEELSDDGARWFDASPAATVEASSVAAGSTARAAVDRRTRGATPSVAWCAAGGRDEWLKLSWRDPLVVRAVVLHAVRPDVARGTHLTIDRCVVRALRRGVEVARRTLDAPLNPEGTRVPLGAVAADLIEIRIVGARGTVEHRPAVALAEVVTEARLTTDADAGRAGSDAGAAQRGTMR